MRAWLRYIWKFRRWRWMENPRCSACQQVAIGDDDWDGKCSHAGEAK